MEWKYTGGVQVIERQTAELTFRFDGMEQKRQRFYASYCILHQYFCAIIGTFNAYVELTGCTNTRHPSSLSDDTPLLHLLSYSTENESSNDLLYAVICDVVRMFIYIQKLPTDCM